MSDIWTKDAKKQLNALKTRMQKVSFPPNYQSDLELYNYDFMYPDFIADFNCYAYAMQFNISLSKFAPDKDSNLYIPGFLSKSVPSDEFYSVDSIIKCFVNDCRFLGLKCEESNLENNLKSNRYKIGILFGNNIMNNTSSSACQNSDLNDNFHFVRQNDDLSWSEKRSWGGEVRIVDRPDKDDHYKLIKVMEISKRCKKI